MLTNHSWLDIIEFNSSIGVYYENYFVCFYFCVVVILISSLYAAVLAQTARTDSTNSASIAGDVAARIPVSPAHTPALVAATGTCMDSTSAGVSAMAFGLSLGSTWHDADCNRRRAAAMFIAMGMPKMAYNIMMNRVSAKEATMVPELVQKVENTDNIPNYDHNQINMQ